MKLQMVGCSHHRSSVEVRERIAFSPDQARIALVRAARTVSQLRGGAAVDLQSRRAVHGGRAAGRLSVARGDGFVFRRISRGQCVGHFRRPVRADGRRRRAAPVHRRRQPRQHGRGRSADRGAGETGLRTGSSGRQCRAACSMPRFRPPSAWRNASPRRRPSSRSG